MILLVDNYDSFVHNLARYFKRLGQTTRVVRNTELDVADVRRIAPDAMVFSPGPCTPQEAGVSLQLVEALHQQLPMLGVCLGHQTLAEALGGKLVRAPEPVHGRTSTIQHDDRGVFGGLPNPLRAARYHSLAVDEASLPECLEVSARTPDGVVMALRHRELPLVGLQFHPESILTQHGYDLLAAFLQIAGLNVAQPQPNLSSERVETQRIPSTTPGQVVTF